METLEKLGSFWWRSKPKLFQSPKFLSPIGLRLLKSPCAAASFFPLHTTRKGLLPAGCACKKLGGFPDPSLPSFLKLPNSFQDTLVVSYTPAANLCLLLQSPPEGAQHVASVITQPKKMHLQGQGKHPDSPSLIAAHTWRRAHGSHPSFFWNPEWSPHNYEDRF